MEFKCGRQNLENGTRPRRPVTVATPEIVKENHDIVMTDMRVTEGYKASNWDFTGKSSFHSYGISCNEKSLSPLVTKTSNN